MKIADTTNASPETIEPASPVRQRKSDLINGSSRMCGSGSQMPPSCAKPGLILSTTRLAIFRCDSASPYATIMWWVYEYQVARVDAIIENTTTERRRVKFEK